MFAFATTKCITLYRYIAVTLGYMKYFFVQIFLVSRPNLLNIVKVSEQYVGVKTCCKPVEYYGKPQNLSFTTYNFKYIEPLPLSSKKYTLSISLLFIYYRREKAYLSRKSQFYI